MVQHQSHHQDVLNSNFGSSSQSPHRLSTHPPTRVLYMRNIGDDVSESEIISACSAFGQVTNVLLLRDKHQGFIEFSCREEAVACLSFHSLHPLTVSSSVIDFAYSGRSSIVLKEAGVGLGVGEPSRVLLLTITRIVYPVTSEVIRRCFAEFNVVVEKLVIFRRGNVVQVLAQIAGDVQTAAVARTSIEGQYIYSACNRIVKAKFSQLSTLDLHSNVDFGEGSQSIDSRLVIPPVLSVSLTVSWQRLSVEQTAEEIAALFAVYGNVDKIVVYCNFAQVYMQDLVQCRTVEQYLKGTIVHGQTIELAARGDATGRGDRELYVKECRDQPLLYCRHKADKFQKLYAPSMSLHLSNMPSDTTEQDLIKFVKKNTTDDVRHIRFLDEQHHIAIILCPSTEIATNILVQIHGKSLGNRPVRVGFGHQPQDPSLLYSGQ